METLTKSLMTGLVVLLSAGVSLASVPLNLPLQGVIRDNAGVPVVEDVFQVTFSLYDGSDAVDPVWTETWPPAGEDCAVTPDACVHVVNGRFRLALGAHSALDVGVLEAVGGLWLGMSVEGEPELARRPLGSAPYALLASRADVASGLDCTGCIAPEALSNDTVLELLDTTLLAVQNAGYVHEGDLSAGTVAFDGADSEIAAGDVQGAIEELKDLIEDKTAGGAGQVNEGAGQVMVYPQNANVPAYGQVTEYVHLVNPSEPKVLLQTYGRQATNFAGSDSLVVAYDFAPNQYSGGAVGSVGDTSLQASNPSPFNSGNHILVYQTVGGSGTTAGTWELNQVLAVNGNNLQLVKALENDYVTDGTAKAQVVLAASFGQLEVVSGGSVRPSEPLAADGSRGGIVYVRANKITVKSGGVIHADAMGFVGGAAGDLLSSGDSECDPNPPAGVQQENCSGGGVGHRYCASSGGGGNQGPGGDGDGGSSGCSDHGQGGDAKGDALGSTLHFGGGGGGSVGVPGGTGGGIVILGAESLVVDEGGAIRANGSAVTVGGGGGGAGGTVTLFAAEVQAETGLYATGGGGGPNTVARLEEPIRLSDISMDTCSEGGTWSPKYREFWYGCWSGTTVRRYDENYNFLGEFSGPDQMMGMWGNADGTYYTANWGYDRVRRMGDMSSNQQWDYHLGSTTGGVCAEGDNVYGMRHSGDTVYRLNHSGNLQETFSLPDIPGGMQGGLVCAAGELWYGNGGHLFRIYDLTTRTQVGELNLDHTAQNTVFDGQVLYTSNNTSLVRRHIIMSANTHHPTGPGGDGGVGWVLQQTPIPGVVNESYPKGVELWVDGVNVTPSVGDPNGKGAPHWDAASSTWGASGLHGWSTGPLDLTNVAAWTLGEHEVTLRETGGAGGELKTYIYVIYPFTESTPPLNDTCDSPLSVDPQGAPAVLSGTTQDTMGKTLATDANQQPGCGGLNGADVVYRIDLTERSLLHAALVAPFSSKLYLRAADCEGGELVYCADKEMTTNPIDAGTYFLFVDSDSANARGDFSLALSTTPAPLPGNDDCSSAEAITFVDGSATIQATTLYALDDEKGNCPAALSGGPDVIYTFDAVGGETLTVDIDADFDPILYLVALECGESGFPLVCSASGSLALPSMGGGSYWLVVDGAKEKEWGNFTLNLTLQ